MENYNYKKIIKDLRERNRAILLQLQIKSVRLVNLDIKCMELQRQIDVYQKVLDEEVSENMDLVDIIDNAVKYNNYLREHCKYRLNDGHLRKMSKILDREKENKDGSL